MDRPVLSEHAYLTLVKRDCLVARQAVDRAASAGTVPAVYLHRVADAAEAMQHDFMAVRPPVRLRHAHRELIEVGYEQLALIRTALERLSGSGAPRAAAELEKANRRLVRRANRIAVRLNLSACVNDPGGS